MVVKEKGKEEGKLLFLEGVDRSLILCDTCFRGCGAGLFSQMILDLRNRHGSHRADCVQVSGVGGGCQDEQTPCGRLNTDSLSGALVLDCTDNDFSQLDFTLQEKHQFNQNVQPFKLAV